VESGALQYFCVDSVDSESWYNKQVAPRRRIERHLEYEQYLVQEVLPFIRARNQSPQLAVTGCSFGGFHAMNFALRHPDLVTHCFPMGAAYDIKQFLDGYYDQECYFNCPPDFLPNLQDPWYLDRYRKNWYLLATGEHDFCWNENERLAAIMRTKGVNHRLDVWRDGAGHDWPWWQKMAQEYFGH
jgi:esterase/lipase superfamily enzyme